MGIIVLINSLPYDHSACFLCEWMNRMNEWINKYEWINRIKRTNRIELNQSTFHLLHTYAGGGGLNWHANNIIRSYKRYRRDRGTCHSNKQYPSTLITQLRRISKTCIDLVCIRCRCKIHFKNYISCIIYIIFLYM